MCIKNTQSAIKEKIVNKNKYFNKSPKNQKDRNKSITIKNFLLLSKTCPKMYGSMQRF